MAKETRLFLGYFFFLIRWSGWTRDDDMENRVCEARNDPLFLRLRRKSRTRFARDNIPGIICILYMQASPPECGYHIMTISWLQIPEVSQVKKRVGGH